MSRSAKKEEPRIAGRLKNKVIVVLLLLCAAAVVAAVILGNILLGKNKAPEVTNEMISERLTTISELATMKMQYRNISHFEDGTVPVLTQKSFNAIYDATLKAGVDLSAATVEVQPEADGQVVFVTLPPAEILSVSIDPASIQFYDERFALFNWQDRTDTVEILKTAEKDIRAIAEEKDVLGQAQKQAETAVSALLTPLMEGREPETRIVFRQKESQAQ